MILAQGRAPTSLWLAAAYMVVASFLFATVNALAKYILITPGGAEIGALQVTFF